MTWRYKQTTGELSYDGAPQGKGYSGRKGVWRNNPAWEAKPGYGPIPRGRWKMTGIYDSKNVGPRAIILEPVGHDAHGRTAFRIHGDSKSGDASRGCIILPRPQRMAMWESGDRELVVI